MKAKPQKSAQSATGFAGDFMGGPGAIVIAPDLVPPLTPQAINRKKKKCQKIGAIFTTIVAHAAGAAIWQTVADGIDQKKWMNNVGNFCARNLIVGVADSSISTLISFFLPKMIKAVGESYYGAAQEGLTVVIPTRYTKEVLSTFSNTLLLSSLWQLYVNTGQLLSGASFSSESNIATDATTVAGTSAFLCGAHFLTHILPYYFVKKKWDLYLPHPVTSVAGALGFYLAGPLPLPGLNSPAGDRNAIGAMLCTGGAVTLAEVIRYFWCCKTPCDQKENKPQTGFDHLVDISEDDEATQSNAECYKDFC